MERTYNETLELVTNIYKELLDVSELDLNEFYNIDANGDGLQYLNSENDKYIVQAEFSCKGGEGEGSEYWTISKITLKDTNEEIFVKFEGNYDSWNGTEWEEVYIVEPKQVKITVYERIDD